MQQHIRTAADHMLTLVYPRRCPVCDRILTAAEGLICSECAGELPWIRQPFCLQCGCPLEDETKEYCYDCMRRHHSFTAGRCIFRYEKECRDSVIRMKFQNRREYLAFYAAAMAAGGKDFLTRIRPRMLLPIPAHRRKKKERGFDQCLLLCRALSARTGIPLEEGNLIRTRYTLAQRGLSYEDRTANVRDAFLLRRPGRIRGPVLLVDDIATTLSTADAACEELRRHGIHDVYFLALCTGRHG